MKKLILLILLIFSFSCNGGVVVSTLDPRLDDGDANGQIAVWNEPNGMWTRESSLGANLSGDLSIEGDLYFTGIYGGNISGANDIDCNDITAGNVQLVNLNATGDFEVDGSFYVDNLELNTINGDVSDVEISYLDGVTAGIQTQFGGVQTQLSNILNGTTAFTNFNCDNININDNIISAAGNSIIINSRATISDGSNDYACIGIRGQTTDPDIIYYNSAFVATTVNLEVAGAHSFTVNSVEIVGTDGEVNKGAVEDSGNWDAAYSHVSSDGSDHSFIDQDVTTTGTPTFGTLTVTGNAAFNGSALSALKGIKSQFTSSGMSLMGADLSVVNIKNSAPILATYAQNFTAYWSPIIGAGSAKTMTNLIGGLSNIVLQLDADETQNMTATNAYGFSVNPMITGSVGGGGVGTMANLYQYKASNPIITGNGSITINGAFYCPAMTAGTTNWGLAINTQSYINANLSVGKATAPATALDVAGSSVLGSASTDTITCTGRWIPRTVAADPTANATAGSLGEIVFFNDKWYGKTVADGTDTNWSALN